MITDAQLDAQLDALKAIAPDESVKFKSVKRFKADFFKRVQALNTELNTEAEKEKRPRKYNEDSIIQRLKMHLLGTRTRAGNRGPRRRAGRRLEGLSAAVMPCSGSYIFPARFMESRDIVFESEECCSRADIHESCIQEPDMLYNGLPEDFNTEEYGTVTETPFVAAARNPLSTFGADVDTAGYTNARRMIMEDNCLPPANSIRLDEFLNYFRYK